MIDVKHPRDRMYMRTDTEIRVDGIRALVDVLSIIEAEKFISLIGDYVE